MPVHIEEIVLQARITDDGSDIQDAADGLGAEDEDDRDDLLRRVILDDCARMIREALTRRMGR
jgi:hypothetical protein